MMVIFVVERRGGMYGEFIFTILLYKRRQIRWSSVSSGGRDASAPGRPITYFSQKKMATRKST
jgi:hypothetical protein